MARPWLSLWLTVWLMMLAALPVVAFADDQGRLSFLEQEVRNLQRQVQTLSRQLDELRTRPARLNNRQPQARTSPGETSDAWLDAAKWRSLRTGMSELEVINALGPPASMRIEDGTRVLLYAMELGGSGFLSGSVKLRDGAVVDVRQPTLR